MRMRGHWEDLEGAKRNIPLMMRDGVNGLIDFDAASYRLLATLHT